MKKVFDFVSGKQVLPACFMGLYFLASGCGNASVDTSQSAIMENATENTTAEVKEAAETPQQKGIHWEQYPDEFMGINAVFLNGGAEIVESADPNAANLTYKALDGSWELIFYKDNAGRLKGFQEITQGSNQKVDFTYKGNLGEGLDPSGKVHKIRYDDKGNLMSWEKRDKSGGGEGFSLAYFRNTHDSQGRVVSQIRYESDGAENPVYYTQFTYNSDEREWRGRQGKRQILMIDVADWEQMELPVDVLTFPDDFESTAKAFSENRKVVE